MKVKYTYWDYLFASWFYTVMAIFIVGFFALLCWSLTLLTGEWLFTVGTMVVLFGVLPGVMWAMDRIGI